MAKLIPLTSIPYSARAAERAARKMYTCRAEALEAASYRIVVAPGCHSRPSDDPPVIGWLLTPGAAEAVANQLTHMPDGTAHRRALAEYRPVDAD